jgi:hypothetical protein
MKSFLHGLSDLELTTAVSQIDICQAENSLNIKLPASLIEILKVSNGVQGEYGLGLIWDLDRLVTDNLHFWSNPNFVESYMPFNHLLFIGDAGNGDQFFIPLLKSQFPIKEHVYAWNHMDDSRMWVATSIPDYLQGWLEGRISV